MLKPDLQRLFPNNLDLAVGVLVFLSSAFGRWIWLEDFLWSSLDLLLQDGMLGRWC